MDRLLTAAEVAEQLRRSPGWVNKAAKAGWIGAHKVGKYWRFQQADVDAYLERSHSRPADPIAMSPASASRRRTA